MSAIARALFQITEIEDSRIDCPDERLDVVDRIAEMIEDGTRHHGRRRAPVLALPIRPDKYRTNELDVQERIADLAVIVDMHRWRALIPGIGKQASHG